MPALSLPLTIVIAPGDHLPFHRPCGGRLRVLQGRAWVTMPNEPDDLFLHAGDTLALAAGVLIGAESELRIRIEPGRAGLRARLRPGSDALARWLRQTPAGAGGTALRAAG